MSTLEKTPRNLETAMLVDEARDSVERVKRKGGQPTTCTPAVYEITRRMLRAGATQKQIALTLGTDDSMIGQWAKVNPRYKALLESERWVADEAVAAALYKKAVGYTKQSVKAMQHNGRVVLAEYTEEVGPDTAAAFIWLKNRQPEQWKDRHEVTGADGKPVEVNLSWVNGRRVVDVEDIQSRSVGTSAPHLEDVKSDSPMLSTDSKE